MKEIEFLAWDSQHFGYKIGRVLFQEPHPDIEKICADARKEGYQLIYLFSEHKLDKLTPVDTKIICEKEAQVHQGESNALCRFAKKELSEDLLALAYESGKYSRFLLEPRFLESQFQSMYKKWIEKSITGELADDVLIYEHEGRIVGFIAYRLKEDCYADICLIAVDPQTTKMGIATKLVHYLENLALSHGMKFLRTTTQLHNEIACAFYKKLQFKTIKTTFIYHLWL